MRVRRYNGKFVPPKCTSSLKYMCKGWDAIRGFLQVIKARAEEHTGKTPKGLNIPLRKNPGFGPLKGLSPPHDMLGYKNIILDPHHNLRVLVK